MIRVQVSIQTVEVRDQATLMQLDVTATANGTFIGRHRPRVMNWVVQMPRSFHVNIDVPEGGSIAIVVGLGGGRSVVLGARLPAEAQVLRHEDEDVTITATLLPLGEVPRVRGRATRDAGGGRATISLGTTPARVRVELVHPIADDPNCPTQGQVARVVRMGLWENAWDGTRFRNGATDDDHFIGLDPRRFYVRVIDPDVRATTVTVNLQTLLQGSGERPGGPYDGNQGQPAITCTAVPGRAGVFVSRALMLVSSAVDVQALVHSGDVPEPGLRTRGQPDFRLRRATMFGHVEAMYARAAAPARAELFGSERRRLRLCLYDVNIARERSGRPIEEIWTTDLRVVREVYGRIGIWVWTCPASEVEPSLREPHPGRSGVDYISHVTFGPAPYGGWLNRYEVELAVATAHPPNGPPSSGVRAFYLPDMGTDVKGESWPARFLDTRGARSSPLLNSLFINTPSRDPYTLAHELMHILMNTDGQTSAETHYNGIDTAHNLLRGPTTPLESWHGSCRIREEQVRAILQNLAHL
ncbi:hypothetical protein BE21_21135 [Sorangium cellulosum]|uniref:Uncharacterized protein n=1 Tax=Sorangium cellulosum TaxID=56 RepID=A0A150TWK0_SORCE|nr:hypothetical protein BE21_21135 [Sorangium cellulosum]